MYICPKKLRAILNKRHWSEERLAEDLDVSIDEVKKMLEGKKIGVDTARRFINFFKIDMALELIDFEKTGIDKRTVLKKV